MTPVPLVARGPVGISAMIRHGPAPLVIVFSSIGHDPARPPSPEFITQATRNGRHALFVIDASRSWANTPDLAPALTGAFAMVAATAGITRVVTLGLSMGGFCALAAAEFLPVDAVFAIGPQFSMHPDIIAEPRWQDHTPARDRITMPSVPLPPGPWRVIAHGMTDDHDQAMLFPVVPGLDHILFAQHGHSDLMPHLKTRGGFQGMLDAVVAGDRRRLLRLTTAAGGRRRLYDPR